MRCGKWNVRSMMAEDMHVRMWHQMATAQHCFVFCGVVEEVVRSHCRMVCNYIDTT